MRYQKRNVAKNPSLCCIPELASRHPSQCFPSPRAALQMQCHLGGIEAKAERITYMRRRQAALLSPETAAADDDDMIFFLYLMTDFASPVGSSGGHNFGLGRIVGNPCVCREREGQTVARRGRGAREGARPSVRPFSPPRAPPRTEGGSGVTTESAPRRRKERGRDGLRGRTDERTLGEGGAVRAEQGRAKRPVTRNYSLSRTAGPEMFGSDRFRLRLRPAGVT